MNLLLLTTAAACYTTAGILMKLSDGLTKPVPSLLLFLVVMSGAAVQAFAVRNAHLGLTYLLVLGLGAGLALVGSVIIFREQFSGLELAGLFFVVAGLACFHVSSA